ncbi:MAG: hypothetical protein F6K58_27095 [Symploca sp. SIO2E9]|nr:hypothetical protein [Symploca sp. SIO2E9]
MPNSHLEFEKQPLVNQSQLSGCLVNLGAAVTIVASGALAAAGIWLGMRLMIEPHRVILPDKFLPNWVRSRLATDKPTPTIAAIEKELSALGLKAGVPLSLNSELLLPVLKSSPNCQSNCERIVELRVYQPIGLISEQASYQLVSRLTITEPEEYFVVSIPTGGESTHTGSSRLLPLTKLSRLEGNSTTEGFWFNLSGQFLSENSPTTYGQVIHYNPEQIHLSLMLEWTTPNQLEPYWQQVTDNSTPELVVNQSVGLEPQFKVYQIQPRSFVPNPIYLEEIALGQPAIDTQGYRNALMLAEHGLWSPAWKKLQSQQQKPDWSAAAQAQMDVIQLHAQVTRSQSRQTWASPSQQILTSLVDGNWADALQVFRNSGIGAPLQEVATLLKTDSGRLWERVEAALKVNPDDSNVKAWGALILAAQQNNSNDQFPKNLDPSSWLQQLPQTEPADYAWIDELIDLLGVALAQGEPSSNHLSQIIGDAQQVTGVNPKDWLQPEVLKHGKEAMSEQGCNSVPVHLCNSGLVRFLVPSSSQEQPTLQLEPQQVWYQVQVTAFNDGQRWQQKPFVNLQLSKVLPARQLWQYLGLETDPRIQITVWRADGTQESTMATVKAVSYQKGRLQLLAAGVPLPGASPNTSTTISSRPLAHTPSALRWLEPSSISLSELDKIQPQWVSAIVPTLWRELHSSEKLAAVEDPSKARILGEIGHWLLQPIDITGNNEPEAVLRVYEDLSVTINRSQRQLQTKEVIDVAPERLYKPRTVIFSQKGTLLYSEFSQDASASLTAIADLGDGGSVALVVDGSNTYNLKRWSAEKQRFE